MVLNKTKVDFISIQLYYRLSDDDSSQMRDPKSTSDYQILFTTLILEPFSNLRGRYYRIFSSKTQAKSKVSLISNFFLILKWTKS